MNNTENEMVLNKNAPFLFMSRHGFEFILGGFIREFLGNVRLGVERPSTGEICVYSNVVY